MFYSLVPLEGAYHNGLPVKESGYHLLFLFFFLLQTTSGANGTSEVMLFGEVWGRSFCRTIEKLVEVVQEYPAEVEHIFSPACVPLWRCAGCCGDENLECVPTDTYNVTMQLLKIKPAERREYVEMTFIEHQRCEYPERTPLKMKGENRRRGGEEKKNRKQKTATRVNLLAGN
ncbi:vascular endothelial growth factor A-like isoform X2 [Acipenser ruthenus]|uniref:vascular endothelial growth factor A-like isoform X2 n=1 Tax=Acipenser ruthenus TaxID=7906 RepID=UPI002741820B|nr:vascular endothelial growth factor A-like isoform X2 [Acipenser ruthenus]